MTVKGNNDKVKITDNDDDDDFDNGNDYDSDNDTGGDFDDGDNDDNTGRDFDDDDDPDDVTMTSRMKAEHRREIAHTPAKSNLTTMTTTASTRNRTISTWR